MSDTIDRLEVALESNVSDFLSNFKRAENAAEDLDYVLNNVEKQSDKTESKIDDLSDTLNEEANSSKNAKTQTDKFNQEIEQTGNKSDKSKGSVSEFNDVLGKVGLGLSVAGVVAAFTEIGKAALDAADNVDDSIRRINVSTGATGEALRNYGDIVGEISREYGYSQSEVSQTLGTVATLNRGIDTASLKDLSSEYQSLSGLLSSVGQSVDIQTIDSAFKKWGITTQEQAAYLKYFYELSQDTGVAVNELACKLADGDREFQLMGLSAEQASKYIADMSYAGELSDINELISAVQKLQMLKSAEMGSDEESQKYIQNMFDTASAMKDESEASKYLQENLGITGKSALAFSGIMFSGTNDIEGTTVALEKYGETLSEIDKLFPSIDQKNTKLGENWNRFLEPVGDQLQDIRDNLIDVLAQEDRLKVFLDLLYAKGWTSSTRWDNGTLYIDDSSRNFQPSVPSQNIIVNQTITAPVYDTTAAERAARLAQKAAFNNPTYH